jgi:nucleoside-diphosphate-sugar epimerase
MKVLVTGGCGNIGRRIVPLLAAEFSVTVYDLAPPLDSSSVRYVRGDILDAASLHWAMQDCDAVVHLAAVPAPGHVSDDHLMLVNVMGTQRVVEAASLGKPTRLIMASSDSVSGMVFSGGEIPPEYIPIDEDHPTRPRDSYGLSKLVGEEICRRYTRRSGLVTVCLRYCWVFWEEHYCQLRQWQGGDARHFRAQMWGYIDVRDVGRAVIAALKANIGTHETLVLSARRNFMNRPTLDLVREYYGDSVTVRRRHHFEKLPDASAFDYSRATQVLGWEPIYDWEEEVAQVV